MERRLGIGLESLFGTIEESEDGIVEKISLDVIQAAKWQPRKEFNESELEELANSIKEYGVLQPVILKRKEDHYEIIAGERRCRAAKIAGLTFVPAMVVDFDEKTSLEVSLIENLQRKDLSIIEKAEGFEFLIEKLKMTQEELSKKLGFSRSYITNFLRINNLSQKIKSKIVKGELSVGHAKILANKKNAEYLAEEVINKKLTVRELEELAKNRKSRNNQEISKFESMIGEALNNAEIKIMLNNNNSGQVIIKFEDLEKLEEIISKICF